MGIKQRPRREAAQRKPIVDKDTSDPSSEENSGSDDDCSNDSALHSLETQRIYSEDDDKSSESETGVSSDEDLTPTTRSRQVSNRTSLRLREQRNQIRKKRSAKVISGTSLKPVQRGAFMRVTRQSYSPRSPVSNLRSTPKSSSVKTTTPQRPKRLPARSSRRNKPEDDQSVGDLADFMANLNASSTSSLEENAKLKTSPSSSSDKVINKKTKVSPSLSTETPETNGSPLSDQKIGENLIVPSTASKSPVISTVTETNTSSTEKVIQDSEKSNECPSNVNAANVDTVDEAASKLKSSIAESEGLRLARRYRRSLRETEEVALNFISQEFHHPVISCFRELTRSDISLIVGNTKLKKSCNNLEQSIVYLGLIDLLATINHNPVYGESENTKLSKNISNIVQKILLEFKNILGTWALSCNEQMSSRYTLIIKYLYTLVPMFKKAGFDEGLSNILNCIEKEVQRHKQNQEKIKAMGGSSRGLENSSDVKTATDSNDAEYRSALNEIVLNVNLNVKPDDSDDDDDIEVLKEDKVLQIFGKPLKGSAHTTDKTKKRIKKPKASINSSNSGNLPSIRHNSINKTPTTPSSSSKLKASFPHPKALAQVFQSSNSPNTAINKSENNTNKSSVKRSAPENDLGEIYKKLKTEDGSIKVSSTERSSIKNFFQPVVSSTTLSSSSTSTSPTSSKPDKPKVNAFTFLMSRSKEIAQKKKVDKINVIPVPTLQVDAVKS